MPAPQDLLDLIAGLQQDADDTASKTQAKNAADMASAAAATAAESAAHDLEAAKAHQSADLEAVVAKLRTSYGVQ